MNEAELLQKMLDAAIDNVNPVLVALLLAVGFLIKHFRPFEKVQNDLIPVVLLVIGFIWSYFETGLTMITVLTAVFSAAVAIGIHQQGKNYFANTIIPKLKELIPGVLQKIFIIGNHTTDTPIEEETIVEELETEE